MAHRGLKTYLLALLTPEPDRPIGEMRCRVTHVASGEQHLFTDWDALVRYLSTGSQDDTPPKANPNVETGPPGQ